MPPQGRPVPKPKPPRPKRQSSLGSNAAAAHGYTVKGPTRKLRPAPKPKPAPRQTLRQAYQRDVSEENQKGSPAQRGAAIRQQNVYEAKARTKAPREAARQRVILRRRDAKKSGDGLVKRLVAVAKGVAGANPIVAPIVGPKPKAVERELTGKGVLAKESAKLAKQTVERGFTVSTGAGPNIAGTAAAAGGKNPKGGALIAAARPQKVSVKRFPKGAQRGLEDLVNAPAAAIPSLYEPVHAAAKAAQGDTKPAKKLIKNVKDTDPLYAAATGNFKKAGRLAAEHPGFAALEVAGVKGAIGRGAGRVVRGAGRVTGSERIANVGATHTRPNATHPYTNLEKTREYSPDLLTKAAQVKRDKVRTRKATKLRKRADETQSRDQDHADALRKQANELDPRVMSAKDLRRHVDIGEAASANRQRRERDVTDKQVTKIMRKAGDKGAAFNLVTQGITKASREDLAKYRDELAREHDTLADPDKRRLNRKVRQAIDRSLASPKGRKPTNLEAVAQAARDYSEQVDVPLDKELSDLGLIPEERAARSKLVPFAAREMGARTVDREALRGEVRAARQTEREAAKGARRAGRSLQTAQRRELRESGRARLLGEDAARVAGRLEGTDVSGAMAEARKGARVAGSSRRKAQRQQLSQYERAGRARGRAEIIVNRSADVRSRKVRPGDATKPRRTLAKLLDERSDMLIADAKVRSTRKAERVAKATLEQARKAQEAASRRRRAQRGQAQLARRNIDVASAADSVRLAEGVVTAARAAREAAERDAKRTGLAGPDNAPLDYGEVARRVAAERDAPPSYLPQGPDAKGRGSYYRSSAREPTISGRQRTERATLEGTMDVSPEVHRARALKARNIVTAAKSYRDNVAEVAYRRKDGDVQPLTRDNADSLARSIEAETGHRFVPVQMEPWGITHEQKTAMRDAINDVEHPNAERDLRSSMITALEGNGKEGKFVLVPEAVAHQMAEHLKVLDPSDFGKMAQALRSSFSRTVLSTSPSPLIGNAVEGAFRSAVAKAGPVSALTTRRVLRKMTPEQRAAFENRVFTGGRVTLSVRPRHFDPDQLGPGRARKIASSWATVKRQPGAKQAAGAWNAWTQLINGWANGHLERGAQHAMAGKAIRESGLLGDGVLRLSDKAMQQAADGLTNTAEQNRLADRLVRDYGQYDGLSPGQRKLIANYTPFAAWWLSAARFVGTLPIHHPTLTALTVANERASQEFKDLKGLQDWLRGTKMIGGTRFQVSRNTPFGAFTDPFATLGSLVLPQGQSMLFNAQGLDWKGDPLRNKNGTPYTQSQRGAQIAKTFLESSIPAYAAPKRAAGYVKQPSSLLNAARVRKAGSKGGKLVKVKPSKSDDDLDLDLDLDLGDDLDLDLDSP